MQEKKPFVIGKRRCCLGRLFLKAQRFDVAGWLGAWGR